ncbi:MAG: ROK family protein [Tenuifilum sp.]|uniref:ROK family protein n=1 Tax=Tenuifilum sp. TaxID=2760880 RepID=UPI001B7ADA56|nr:ROK family protein [Bacteroidales bacterium]HOK60207.1 ROK family protein [Tenuifilum sp.]MBP9028917.1 ROK family protein [Bacteroidales bacterium]HOK85087.1 ROK family protein [Tenuifilum sp.]HON70132.1 ROK family protein [Tenuifilum sp.]
MAEVVAGIDIGGTNTVIGIVNRNGDILAESTLPTRCNATFDVFVKNLTGAIEQLLMELGHEHRLLGVGVGSPNGSYNLGAIVDAPNLEWKGILPLCKEITLLTGVPSVVTNDANAAALGELLFGAAKGMKNFVVITLGTGLGSGIVVDGKLVVGHDGFAGEFGHVVAKANGRQCGCGKKGCLETYASATGLRRTAFKMIADSNQPSMLRNVTYDKLTAKMITEAAKTGDPLARAAFEYTGLILGTRLADLVAILNPEAIFFFGGLANAGELLMDPVRRYMEDYMFPVFKGKVKLLLSGLQDKNAAVLGAAALIWEELDKSAH